MKVNIIYVLMLLLLCACAKEEDTGLRVDRLTDEDTGLNTVLLNDDIPALFTFVKTAPNQTRELIAEIAKLGIPSSQNINYTVEVVESATNVVEGQQYTIEKSGSIPAGTLIQPISITILLDSVEPEQEYQLTLQLTSAGSDFKMEPVTFFFTVVCEGDLATEYTYTNFDTWEDGPFTGTGQITGSDGEYKFSDFSFGSWKGVYNINNLPEGSLQLVEDCGSVAYMGKDRYNEKWTMTEIISSGGPEFTFKYENENDEFGTVTLRKTDGSDWPILSL